MKIDSDKFEEYMERLYEGFVVSRFKVVSNKNKYVTIDAEVVFYGTSSLIAAMGIWSGISKVKKAKAGLKVNTCRIHDPRVKTNGVPQYAYMEIIAEIDKEKIG